MDTVRWSKQKMTWRKHTKQSLLIQLIGAVKSIFPRTRTSLYQPLVPAPLQRSISAHFVPLPVQPVRPARIIPFPQPPPIQAGQRRQPLYIPMPPFHKVPKTQTVLPWRVGIR
jgi:hypothetical protein